MPSAKLVQQSWRMRRAGWAVVVGLTWIAAALLAWGASASGVY